MRKIIKVDISGFGETKANNINAFLWLSLLLSNLIKNNLKLSRIMFANGTKIKKSDVELSPFFCGNDIKKQETAVFCSHGSLLSHKMNCFVFWCLVTRRKRRPIFV